MRRFVRAMLLLLTMSFAGVSACADSTGPCLHDGVRCETDSDCCSGDCQAFRFFDDVPLCYPD